jgi:hypothetical protein
MALLSGPTISSAINEPTNGLAKLVEAEKDDRKLINDVFLRVLNRPASDSEMKNVLALLTRVDSDNASITNELGPLEVKMAPVIEDLKHKRDDAIGKSKADLATYDEMTKSLRAELEKRRESEITLRNGELKDYEKLLPAQAAFWETKSNPAETKTVWVMLEPEKVSATAKVKLRRPGDGSVTSTNGGSPSDFTITTSSSLTNITGVMLEVLPDETLPRFGPGRNPEGNFVLSEIELKWAEGTNAPDTAVKLADARADFSQADYAVAQAIDGKVQSGQNGWAIGGAPGIQRHTATFKPEQPLTSTNGVTLRFVLKQQFGEQFLIGKFRLYATGSADPLDFGAPENVVQAAKAPAGKRTADEASAILEFYRYSDAEFWKRKLAAVKAAEPLPLDPKLSELQKALQKAEEPIRLDPYLVQLREAAQASGRQLENKRLTVVQDLAWALINSTGFLFNH